MPATPTDDDDARRLEERYQERLRSGRVPRPRKRPRSPVRAGLVALGIFALLAGIIPVARYVDAVTVPGGVEAQRAEVLDEGRTDRALGTPKRGRGRGHSATVRLPDGSEGTVLLGRRLDYPEVGDTLTVYREDGDPRTTVERSVLELVGGILVLLLVPLLGFFYWRSERRHGRDGRPHVG